MEFVSDLETKLPLPPPLCCSRNAEPEGSSKEDFGT